MAGFFAKVFKVVTIGAGTVLSLFNPAAGAAVIAGGAKINTKVEAVDKVAAAAKALSDSYTAASAGSAAIDMSLSLTKAIDWLKANPLYAVMILISGVAAVMYFFKGTKKRRRR